MQCINHIFYLCVYFISSMILSMTGFGRAEGNFENKKLSVDLKSLNSKSFDLNSKIPLKYREKEFEIRKILNDQLLRGKVDCYINCENLAASDEVKINQDLVKSYMQQLRSVAADAPDFEYLKMAVRLPDAITANSDGISDSEWNFLHTLLLEAVANFKEFRKTEGKNLQNVIQQNIANIAEYLLAITPFEEERMITLKEKYKNALQDFDSIDETRFYQEITYYIEKLDISEEKVRLEQHLKYFNEVMENEDFNGKKLGFISQEIGREINTLGSKANHHEIQKLVVMMKDELEKIKEQTLNIL